MTRYIQSGLIKKGIEKEKSMQDPVIPRTNITSIAVVAQVYSAIP